MKTSDHGNRIAAILGLGLLSLCFARGAAAESACSVLRDARKNVGPHVTAVNQGVPSFVEWKGKVSKYCVADPARIQSVTQQIESIRARLKDLKCGKFEINNPFNSCFKIDGELKAKKAELSSLTNSPDCDVARKKVEWWRNTLAKDLSESAPGTVDVAAAKGGASEITQSLDHLINTYCR